MDKTRKHRHTLKPGLRGKMREKQRRTYMNIIEQHGRLKGKTLREIVKITVERKTWKAFSRTHPTP